MLEQRKAVRRRTLLQGRIQIEKLSDRAWDCSVRNVSEAGARLTIPGYSILPEIFDLGISGGRPLKARLVWYRDGQAGVTLLEPSPKSEAPS